jgi:hypothetical protein
MLVSVLGAFALATLLWSTPVIYPLKILVVFFHEISHAAVGILGGATAIRITLHPDEGGRAWASGGSAFLMANAGYLGSLIWGSALVLVAAHSRRDRIVIAILGIVLGAITIAYVRNLFGVAFGLAASAALVAAGRWLADWANDFLLKLIGTTSMGYAVLDIWSDVISRSHRSDATILAAMTGIPALVWGGLWIALSIAGICATLVLAARAAPGRGDGSALGDGTDPGGRSAP